MAFIADRVLDLGLNILTTEATRIDICSSEPTDFTQATSTFSLGNKTSLVIDPPEDREINEVKDGRKVVVPLITDGNVTGTATATHYAIVDTNENRLLATGDLLQPQVVTAGNTFALAPFDIGIPGAVNEPTE